MQRFLIAALLSLAAATAAAQTTHTGTFDLKLAGVPGGRVAFSAVEDGRQYSAAPGRRVRASSRSFGTSVTTPAPRAASPRAASCRPAIRKRRYRRTGLAGGHGIRERRAAGEVLRPAAGAAEPRRRPRDTRRHARPDDRDLRASARRAAGRGLHPRRLRLRRSPREPGERPAARSRRATGSSARANTAASRASPNARCARRHVSPSPSPTLPRRPLPRRAHRRSRRSMAGRRSIGDKPPVTDRLPIDAAVPELLAALRAHGRAVLQAPPGAGKTTRVPLAILEAGLVPRPDRHARTPPPRRPRRGRAHGRNAGRTGGPHRGLPDPGRGEGGPRDDGSRSSPRASSPA
jgi:hypothetical protein